MSGEKPQSKSNAFYGIASGFYSLKTVQDQESVVKCLKAFRNFKVSKSPEPATNNNRNDQQQQYYEGSLNEGSEEQNQDQNPLFIKFQPNDYIDPEEIHNEKAIANLGLKKEEFYREIHIQDFYNIKESKQMQLRRYFSKVQEIQQKIKAIMLERQRIEKEQNIKTKEKKLLASKVLRWNQGNRSPQISRGTQNRFFINNGQIAEEESKFTQKLKDVKKDLAKELQLNTKQYMQNETKVNVYQHNNQVKRHVVHNQISRDIEKKVNSARNMNMRHQNRMEQLRQEEKEQEKQRIEKNKEIKKDQLDFFAKKEKDQKDRLKKQYERDQDLIHQHKTYLEKKRAKEIQECEKSEKMKKQLEQRVEEASERQKEYISTNHSDMKEKQNKIQMVIDNYDRKNQEYERDVITNYYNKQSVQQVYQEQIQNNKLVEIQKIKVKHQTKIDKNQQRLREQQEDYEEYLNQNQIELNKRMKSSEQKKREFYDTISSSLGFQMKEKQLNTYYYNLQKQDEIEQKKDQALMKYLEKKNRIDKHQNEYTSYVKKKLQLRINQKKQLAELAKTYNAVKEKVRSVSPRGSNLKTDMNMQQDNNSTNNGQSSLNNTKLKRENNFQQQQMQNLNPHIYNNHNAMHGGTHNNFDDNMSVSNYN